MFEKKIFKNFFMSIVKLIKPGFSTDTVSISEFSLSLSLKLGRILFTISFAISNGFFLRTLDNMNAKLLEKSPYSFRGGSVISILMSFSLML